MATPTKKPAAQRKPAAKSGSTSGARKTPARNKDGSFKKSGDNSHWGTAAIVGGVAAVGAIATAALFALRGSSLLTQIEETRLGDDDAEGDAYQADGSDSSASYNARIADEGTIPA